MRTHHHPPVSTFSIVARDPTNGDLGVAVESKFLAVGAVVPWVKAGIGAIATQALANVTFGPRGLALLAEGKSAREVVEALVAADGDAERRQFGVVDHQGRAASFTGAGCSDWAGGIEGEGFCCQGNILTGPEVVAAMAEAYRGSEGSFVDRLLMALEWGQAAGGDSRGQQAAAIYVAREGGGYGGGNDRYIDLRVDDHPRPIAELRRLVDLHRVYFRPDEAELVPLDDELRLTIRRQLEATGELEAGADERAVVAALERFAGRENLEERLRDDGQIDSVILEFLRERAERHPAPRDE